MAPKSIPERWEPYTSIGYPVRGTRFIAFKVPLKEHVCARLQPKHRWTIDTLCDTHPDIGMIIDLTMTTRYYDFNDVLDKGVDYCKIPLPGQKIPSDALVKRFFAAVDFYLDRRHDGSLIGVHCTHGVNRTGYMIARYLIQRMGYSVSDALESITVARGHPIERENYVSHLGLNTIELPKLLNGRDIQPGRLKQTTMLSQAKEGKFGGIHPAGNAFANKGKGNVRRHGPARGNVRDSDSSWNPLERNLSPWKPGCQPKTPGFGQPDPGFRNAKRSEFAGNSECDRRSSPGGWEEWKAKEPPRSSIHIPQFDEPPRFVPDNRRDYRQDSPGRKFSRQERFDGRRKPPSYQGLPAVSRENNESFSSGRPEVHHLEERSFDHGRIEHREIFRNNIDEKWDRDSSMQHLKNEMIHDHQHSLEWRAPHHYGTPGHGLQSEFRHPVGRDSSPRGRQISPPRRHFNPPQSRSRSPIRGRPHTPSLSRPLSPPRHSFSQPRSRPMSPRGRSISPMRGRPQFSTRGRPASPRRRMSPTRGPRMSPSRGYRMSPPRPRMSPGRQSPSYHRFPPRQRMSPLHEPRMSPPPLPRPPPRQSGTRMSPPRASMIRMSPGRRSPHQHSPLPRPPRVSPPRGIRRMTPPPSKRMSPRAHRISPSRSHNKGHPHDAEILPRPKGRRMSPPRLRMGSPEMRMGPSQHITKMPPPPPRNIPPNNPRARVPHKRRSSPQMDRIPLSLENDIPDRFDHLDERYGPGIEPFPLERSPPRLDHQQSLRRMQRDQSPVMRQGSPIPGISQSKRRRLQNDVPFTGRENLDSYPDEEEAKRRMPAHGNQRGYSGSQQRGRKNFSQNVRHFEQAKSTAWGERESNNRSQPGTKNFGRDDPGELRHSGSYSSLEELRNSRLPERHSSPRRIKNFEGDHELHPNRQRSQPRAAFLNQSHQALDRNNPSRNIDREGKGGAKDGQSCVMPPSGNSRKYQNLGLRQNLPRDRSLQYDEYSGYSHHSSANHSVADDMDQNDRWDEGEPEQDCRELLLQKRVTRSIGALSPTALDLIGPDDEVIVIEESSTDNSRSSSRARRPVAVKLRKSPSSSQQTKPIFDRLDGKKTPVFGRLDESNRQPLAGGRTGSLKPQSANPRTDRPRSRPGVARHGDNWIGNKTGETPGGNRPRGSPSRGTRVATNNIWPPSKTDQPARPTRVSRPLPKMSPVKSRLGQRGRR